MIFCWFCAQDGKTTELDPEASMTYRKVTGWERPRLAGGTNAVALRAPHDEWACWECIHKQGRGIPVGQGSLL